MGLKRPGQGSSSLRGPEAARLPGPGWTSIVSPQGDIPVVALRLLVPGGSWEDPPGKEGIAYLAAQLLPEGTRRRAAPEIHLLIDGMGGRFSVEANGDYTMLGLSVLREDLDQALGLLVELLREPSFPEEEFHRRRERILGEIASQEDRPGGLAHRAFLQALWGSSGYGHDPRGLRESLESLGPEDVWEHYRERVRPRQVLFVAVGDLEPGSFQRRLWGLMEGWEGGDEPIRSGSGAQLPEGSRVIIHRDLPQATVLLGQRSVARDHPDLYALWVMNYILGAGGFASRLMEEIRSRRGLAYAVSSDLDARMRGGSFRVGFQTENRNVLEAVEIAREQAERIRLEPVCSRELEEAKGFLVGSFPMRLDSHSSTATSLALWEFYGLGLDYPERFASSVLAVDVGAVMRVAQEHLEPDAWVQVLVGDSKAMGL